MKNIVLVTGGFDPLHSGHIEYFKAAKELGDELHVGVNSDEWLTNKKGRPFMPFKDRATIIENLSCVDKVLSFDDSDGSAMVLYIRHWQLTLDVKLFLPTEVIEIT